MRTRSWTSVNIILSAVLLTSIFLVGFTASSSQGEYDPWIDSNEDGSVDIFDAIMLANVFGTTGDPTKNVTVTGHANKLIKAAYRVSVPSGDAWGNTIYTVIDGYSKVTVLIATSDFPNHLYIYCSGIPPNRVLFLIEDVSDFGANFVKTYDVMNQEMNIRFVNLHTDPVEITVQIYLIA